MVNKYKHWVFFLYLVCQMIVNFMPGKNIPNVKLPEGTDKVIHFTLYVGFSTMLCYFLSNQKKSSFVRENRFFMTFIMSFLYGMMEETIQGFIIYRSSDVMDLNADVLGAAVGIFLYAKGGRSKHINT